MLGQEELVGIVDADGWKYSAAFVGDKRSIHVTHPQLGSVGEYKNRTEFFGSKKGEDGGVLLRLNKGRESPFLREEFSIEEVLKPEPLENCLYTCKSMISRAKIQVGVNRLELYIGEGKSFRDGRATLLKYKGDRPPQKPTHLEAVAQYMQDRWHAEVVSDIEADDKVIIEAYNKPNHIVLSFDKDTRSQPVKFFDLTNPNDGIVDGRGFGDLFRRDGRSKVSGSGRLHLYLQILIGDDTDNIKPRYYTTAKYGQITALKHLSECKNDRECWQHIVNTYKSWYPEKQTIVNFRGDTITFDWLYVLQEVFDLVRMLRWEGDTVNVVDVLNKLKVDY